MPAGQRLRPPPLSLVELRFLYFLLLRENSNTESMVPDAGRQMCVFRSRQTRSGFASLLAHAVRRHGVRSGTDAARRDGEAERAQQQSPSETGAEDNCSHCDRQTEEFLFFIIRLQQTVYLPRRPAEDGVPAHVCCPPPLQFSTFVSCVRKSWIWIRRQ